MGNQRQHTEDAEDRSPKAEHKSRAAEYQRTDPDKNGQSHDNRGNEYFQYQPHNIGLLFISDTTILLWIFICKDAAKKWRAAYTM